MSEFERAYEIAFIRAKLLILQERALLHKQVLGAEFTGVRPWMVATYLSQSRGLHAITYTVVRPDGLPVGGGESLAEALADARKFLATWSTAQQDEMFVRAKEACVKFCKEEKARREAEFHAWQKDSNVVSIATKKVPKRRQAVFDKSEGKCHYCSTPLTLDGKWHIEHKMPRALLGGSEQSNLVAACVSCNLRKRDKTDLEFIAKEAARK